jgi:hypothetical protein
VIRRLILLAAVILLGLLRSPTAHAATEGRVVPVMCTYDAAHTSPHVTDIRSERGPTAASEAGRTALEVRLPRLHHDAITQSPEVLRGYSWVTICAPGLVERLGGIDALRASGALMETRLLDYGAVLARASDTFEQYDRPATSSPRR